MNAFIKCHFNYCPLIWMFHSRALEQKINHLHERVLRIVYSDYTSSFQELLKARIDESKDDRIFHKNKCKIKTRKRNSFRSREVESELNGKSSLAFLGPKIWASIPNDLKALKDIDEFKSKIKRWRPSTCPCRNCRTYIQGVGYL